MPAPIIIQGGMSVAVFGWPLACAVSRLGQLGPPPPTQRSHRLFPSRRQP
jgi:NAD(P)H-dependent flavin oxidoreductase YrpB (nitropropane dioxygenase family)